VKLSPEQVKALDAVNAWAKEGWRSNVSKPFFTMAGYAGTGKTTLTQYFINQQSEPVTCCAPTGKAASVLEKKLTNARVSTIHAALYKPVAPSLANLQRLEQQLVLHPGNRDIEHAIEKEKKRLARKNVSFGLKDEADRLISPGQLVIIDEASMVTRRMHQDLLNTNARILYVGDPGQLPPVQDKGFFQEHRPDAMLEQVQRQALDSPIIRISMRVRNGENIERTYDADKEGVPFRKLPKQHYPGERWLDYDQVITGSNDSRRKINRYFRGKKGFKSWWPEDGDKLICLKNDSETEIYYINGILASSISKALYAPDFGEIVGNILYEDMVVNGVIFYRYPFHIHYDPAAVEEPWQVRQSTGMKEFDYAYAITVHKSQGSEWDRVILADDGFCIGGAEFRKRWLYTAVTRAKEELLWLY
jgi:exodeoxyribonuclease-5